MVLFQRSIGLLTGKLSNLPVLVLMPHSSCNCRCVMCDIWKANHDKRELSVHDLQPHMDDLMRLGVRHVTLSGGEALLHSNLWTLCEMLTKGGMSITLLTTGLTLERHATEVVRHFNEVIVSLDGTPDLHNEIRNIPSAFEKLTAGVAALRKLNPDLPIRGRCVLQRRNFRMLQGIIDTAKSIGLTQISFLAADVSTTAFNRPVPWDTPRAETVALDEKEAEELALMVNKLTASHAPFFANRFIAESPEKLLRLAGYYKSLAIGGSASAPACNAPWVSAVVESNGDMLPCFFHKPYGNIRDGFEKVLNSEEAIRFRRKLDVGSDPICQKCVCSLHLPLWSNS